MSSGDRCRDILCDKLDDRGSAKRTLKMARVTRHVQNIYDAVLDLSNRSKLSRCGCDAISIACWPLCLFYFNFFKTVLFE